MAMEPSGSTAQSSTTGSGFTSDVICIVLSSRCCTRKVVFGILKYATVSTWREARSTRAMGAESGISGGAMGPDAPGPAAVRVRMVRKPKPPR